MNIDKEFIKEEYLKSKAILGRQPGSKEFYKLTGISEYQVIQHFHKYTSLVNEMGDIQKSFGEKYYNKEDYWDSYGNLTRQLNRIPSSSDWLFYKCKPLKTSFLKKFGKNWTDMSHLFFDYAVNNSEWNDIIHLFANNKPTDTIQTNQKSYSLESKYSQFIPPILNNFLSLSIQEGSSNEFEKQVNLIFQMLGFETTYFGQGTGRNPDSIAKATQYNYAVLVDAKARKDAYQIGTEDRKFIEYIKTHTSNLNKTGHGIIYFLIVSSEFSTVTENSIRNIVKETNVVTTLIKASTLSKLLAKKIEYPSILNLEILKELFITPGVITDNQVDKFLFRLKLSK
jgi:hypothetical protein